MLRALLALLIVTLAAPGVVSAVTITDTASGSLTPPLAPFDQFVVNGDFLIHPNLACAVCPIGDGIDELTTWTFDFTGDPDFPSFPPGGPLTSALLTVTVTPGNAGITTDVVGIQGLPFIVTPTIQGLPVGVTNTIQLQLLDFYTSPAILGVLSANAGQIPMQWHDDVILSFAQLDLVVAEPGALLLLAAGLLGVGACRHRKERKFTV